MVRGLGVPKSIPHNSSIERSSSDDLFLVVEVVGSVVVVEGVGTPAGSSRLPGLSESHRVQRWIKPANTPLNRSAISIRAMHLPRLVRLQRFGSVGFVVLKSKWGMKHLTSM